MNNLYFNNKSAYDDLDLVIVNSINYPFIAENIETVEVEGRKDGNLTIKTGNYKDININVNFRIIKLNNYKNRIRSITMWLTNIKNNVLYFDDYREKCYKVKYCKLTNIADSGFKTADFQANFVCEPYIYKNNEQELLIANNSEFYYDGDLESYPIIELELPTTQQNISITIGPHEFQLREVSEYVKINSKLMNITDKNNLSLSKKMIGNFPYLELGYNYISWTGTINKFTLNKNTIYRG